MCKVKQFKMFEAPYCADYGRYLHKANMEIARMQKEDLVKVESITLTTREKGDTIVVVYVQ